MSFGNNKAHSEPSLMKDKSHSEEQDITEALQFLDERKPLR